MSFDANLVSDLLRGNNNSHRTMFLNVQAHLNTQDRTRAFQQLSSFSVGVTDADLQNLNDYDPDATSDEEGLYIPMPRIPRGPHPVPPPNDTSTGRDRRRSAADASPPVAAASTSNLRAAAEAGWAAAMTVEATAPRRGSNSTISAASESVPLFPIPQQAILRPAVAGADVEMSPSPLLLEPPVCNCGRSTIDAPSNIDWAVYKINNPPANDTPFLCHKCGKHYTHRYNDCSQMKGIPWILPEMEADFACLHCWSLLTSGEQKLQEEYFMRKHGARFGLVNVPFEDDKYLRMFDTIMGE